ncbi:MAG TPA: hypothetical protein VE954_32905 [Oligoflexus sp.]|uniref:hypothetical protein n=1 Tax=Oligoflexus sp. TaxID=1971216 RepID=UPI002D260EA0|nr:hypothetical protein [Oligoflexus sp.]HYX37927.1 hypothetical protein [Oligoflexus sp.]
MKEGLEEFLKRIEAKPTNETLIDRFVTLVLEEDVLERILYLKKLVGLLLTPNPYAALKAAALELQEARKEKLTKEYEIGALKDVESCFLKLEKMDNAQLVRDEINKLQGDMARDHTSARGRTPPPQIPQAEPDEDMTPDVPLPARQARVHFRLPSPEMDGDDYDDERTARHVPADAENTPPPPRAAQRSALPTMPDPFAKAPQAPLEPDFQADAMGYAPRRKSQATEAASSFTGNKEFYDKNLEDTDDRPDESARRSSLSRASGIKVGPNLLETPDDREPQRPRSAQSVFETTDVFADKPSKIADVQPTKNDKASRSSKDTGTKNKSRQAFEPNEYVPDSNSMFQESQHVHFPDTSANRSIVRQEARNAFSYDIAGSQVAGSPLENTEILPDSNLMNAAIPFDNEVTRQLDPEELAQAVMPIEPAFPPRDFDIPPYDVGPNREAKAPSSSKNKGKDPFADMRDANPAAAREPMVSREPDVTPDVFAPSRGHPQAHDPFAKSREPVDPFAGIKEPAQVPQSRDPFAGVRTIPIESHDPFAGMHELPSKDPIPFPKEMAAPKAAPAASPVPGPLPIPGSKTAAQPGEPRWNLLRDRLRLLSGIQISRSHASDFVLRLLGEHSSRDEQQEVLSILMRVLEGPRQTASEQRFQAFLFEELQPKALHQLLGALKIGDQTVAFFVDYLQALMKESQLRRMLNVIHAVIIPGLDLSWYQESYRFLMMIWPELGLKGWHWLEEEGPMVFCDRLAEREDLLPATLLA